jgi:hypothetical protein
MTCVERMCMEHTALLFLIRLSRLLGKDGEASCYSQQVWLSLTSILIDQLAAPHAQLCRRLELVGLGGLDSIAQRAYNESAQLASWTSVYMCVMSVCLSIIQLWRHMRDVFLDTLANTEARTPLVFTYDTTVLPVHFIKSEFTFRDCCVVRMLP